MAVRRLNEKLAKGTKTLPYGAKAVYHCRTDAVDFLKNAGGPIGVTLVLDLANVKRLRSVLKTCGDAAAEVGRDKVEIDAHWGRKTGKKGKKGFLLDVTVG